MDPNYYNRTTPSGGCPDEGFRVVTDKFAGAGKITPQILQALRRGDPDAYKAVYTISHTPLFKLLQKTYPKFDAEEITQAVMVEIWDKREMIDPEKNFGAYIYRMAVSYANKMYRRHKVESGYLDYLRNCENESDAADDLVIEKQTRLLIDIVLSRMPERRRQIYEMSRNEGLTYEQIAEELKISKKSVEYHMSLALKDFREVLALFMLLLTISQ